MLNQAFVGLFVLLSLGLITSFAFGGSIPESLNRVIENHCVDCHDAEATGGLNLQSLDWDLEDPHITGVWVKIHDRLASGGNATERD